MRRVVAALAAGVVLAGCSVGAEPGATPSSDSPSGAPSDTAPSDTAPSTPLYELDHDGTRGSGERTDAVLVDGSRHPGSTALWVSCEDTADSVTFQVDGHEKVTGRLALREGTPAGVIAIVQIDTDAGPVGAYQVDHDGGVDLNVILDGSDTITFLTQAKDGGCGDATESYLVIADGGVS